MSRRRKPNRGRPTPRRQLGSLDGRTLHGGCPHCDAEVEYHTADHRLRVAHDDDCPVLSGDIRAQLEASVATRDLLEGHVDEPVVIVGRLS